MGDHFQQQRRGGYNSNFDMSPGTAPGVYVDRSGGSPSNQRAPAKPSPEPDARALSPEPARYQEAYLELDQEKRRLQSELRGKSEESVSLAREAQLLREQIAREQEKRKEKVAELARTLEGLERDNKHLNMKLMKVQMQDSAKLSDVTTVKKEVVTKTMELEKMMRDFQQTHQQVLFTKVKGITGAMLAVCQKPDFSMEIPTPVPTTESLGNVMGGGAGEAFSSTAPAAEGQSASYMDPETQQALKRRLQSLGDVVVFTSDNFEACCASERSIPPGALRIRPRRCDHVFLIECLLPYWAEGLCPVCRTSFAYENRDNWNDESDKYSSVSTSVSQRLRPGLARPPIPSSVASDASSALLRGQRAMRANANGAALGGDPTRRQRRSSSASRAQRRRRSPGGEGPGSPSEVRSEISRGRGGSSSVGPNNRGSRGLSMSPPRSVVSEVQSRASSVPRERYGASSPTARSGASQVPSGIAWGGSDSGARRGPL